MIRRCECDVYELEMPQFVMQASSFVSLRTEVVHAGLSIVRRDRRTKSYISNTTDVNIHLAEVKIMAADKPEVIIYRFSLTDTNEIRTAVSKLSRSPT
jgi:hypothetical protein